MNKAGLLRDILVVLAPWAILGPIGEWLGDDTAAGAVFITLSYVLAVMLATVVLKRRGSGWRDNGLARPDSWRKTILLGLGVLLIVEFILLGGVVVLLFAILNSGALPAQLIEVTSTSYTPTLRFFLGQNPPDQEGIAEWPLCQR